MSVPPSQICPHKFVQWREVITTTNDIHDDYYLQIKKQKKLRQLIDPSLEFAFTISILNTNKQIDFRWKYERE